MAVNILIQPVIVDGLGVVGVFLPMDGPTPVANKILKAIIVSSVATPVGGSALLMGVWGQHVVDVARATAPCKEVLGVVVVVPGLMVVVVVVVIVEGRGLTTPGPVLVEFMA